jgi:hypothetical protein
MTGAPKPTHDPPFLVICKAGEANQFSVETNDLLAGVAQRIRRDGKEQMWDSLRVYGEVEADGSLVVRILVFHPDWDEPLQIAAIRSRPDDAGCLTPLVCNLDHVNGSGQ